jgi:site-specific recombinase xerD|nr:site-specific integrase [Alistipes sp.]
MGYTTEVAGFYTRLAVDLFSFSYLMGGINFVDMANLTRNNIIDGRLVYRRQKTGKLLNLPIHAKAMEIIESYATKDLYLFPIYSKEHKTIQQKLNRHHKVITKVNRALAEIGKELKIPIKLTTYVARHSYATVLKRSGVPTSIISESLGHSSERVTQIYLDSFENERMNEVMQHLI